MSDGKVKILTKNSFKSEVLDNLGVSLVDFWAAWCGPCRMVGPVIEEVAQELGDKALVGKINVDDENEIAAQFKVMSIPTVILFKNGQEMERVVGARTKKDYIELVNKHI